MVKALKREEIISFNRSFEAESTGIGG